jgi:hypothetical protein
MSVMQTTGHFGALLDKKLKKAFASYVRSIPDVSMPKRKRRKKVNAKH